MTEPTKGDNLEARIIETAKQMFIERGFTETSMCDIAARVGINRPCLHYYFRTKDRLYQAVFGEIISSFLPQVKDIILHTEVPIMQRVERLVDAYYGHIFKENPQLPIFIIKEMDRDVDYLLNTVRRLGFDRFLYEVFDSLQAEMDAGKLKPVPPRMVFYTFYGGLIMPFVSRNLAFSIFLEPGETFDELLLRWKPYVIRQMAALLCVPSSVPDLAGIGTLPSLAGYGTE